MFEVHDEQPTGRDQDTGEGQSNGKLGWVGVGTILIVILLVVGAIQILHSRRPERHSGPEGPVFSYRYAAYVECTHLVADDLDLPPEADFRQYGGPREEVPQILEPEADLFRVTSHVDFENAAGAMVRTDFVCSVMKAGESWQLESLEFDE